jgi:integrase/recombinase XerD
MRREVLCLLHVRDVQSRQGVMHFRVKGKRDKIRFVPVHPSAQRPVEEYLALAGHGQDLPAPVFRPVTNNHDSTLEKPLDPGSAYHNIIRKYGREDRYQCRGKRLCVHSMRDGRDQYAHPRS